MKLSLALLGLIGIGQAAAGNVCHVCEESIEINASGTNERLDVNILHGCDLNFDGYDDIKMCFRLRNYDKSKDASEQLIGVAFDIFNGYPFPTDLMVSEIVNLGPDHACVPEENTWIAEDQICTEDEDPECKVHPDFTVSGNWLIKKPFDVAVKFDSGSSEERVHHACFLLSIPDCSLPMYALEGSDFYSRFTYTGGWNEYGDEDSKSKMVGKIQCGVEKPEKGTP